MTRRNFLTRLALCGCLLFISLSLLLAALPMQPAKPLIAKGDWTIIGQAFPVTPRNLELRKSIIGSAESTYWRSWSSNTQATKAKIITKPFIATKYMAIPYGGFAGTPGIEVYLKCLVNNNKLDIATATTNTDMTEALVKTPPKWCPGTTILVGSSNSTTKYLEVGTPFKISWKDYYKNSFLGLFGIFLLTFILTWGLIIVPDAVTSARGKSLNPIITGMSFLGLLGYAMFFIFFWSKKAGLLASGCLFLFELCLFLWLGTKHKPTLSALWSRWRIPTILWACAAFCAFCLAMASHNGAGSWTTNDIFRPVHWSSDNQLPMQISEFLFRGWDVRSLDLGPWLVSDRPPLAYGLMSTLRLISWAIANHGDGSVSFYQYHLISGIVINALWIVALYYLLSELNIKGDALFLLALVVGLTPFAIFNSVFIWPKMLGAAFGLLAFTLLFEPSKWTKNNQHPGFDKPLIWAALLSGLALISHGGTAFGVIAAILVSFLYRGIPSPRLGLTAALVGLLVLIPWTLWQHLEQPPGNALIKYTFSGNFGFDNKAKSVLATVVESYSKLTLESWAEMKFKALRVLFDGSGSSCGTQELDPVDTLFGHLRSNDFFYLGPSLRFLALGIIPLIFATKRAQSGENKKLVQFARIMVGTGILAVGLYCFFAFDCYINHMQSYQSVLEIILGLAIILYQSNKWYSKLLIFLSLLYGIIVWIVDPIFSTGNPSVAPIACISLLAFVIIYKITRKALQRTSRVNLG